MNTVAQKTTMSPANSLHGVMVISAWGFVIVLTSFLFLYLGYRLDQWLGTAPNFMFGLFFLAIVTTIGRLYQEAWARRNQT